MQLQQEEATLSVQRREQQRLHGQTSANSEGYGYELQAVAQSKQEARQLMMLEALTHG